MTRAVRSVPQTFAPSATFSAIVSSLATVQVSVQGKTRPQIFGEDYDIVSGGATGLWTVQYSSADTTYSLDAPTIESTYPDGHATHWGKDERGWLYLTYNAGEKDTASASRCQALLWPITTGPYEFYFECDFSENWTLRANGDSPALIWQLKPSDGSPSWNVSVDTSSTDATQFTLQLGQRTSKAGAVTVRASVTIDPADVLTCKIRGDFQYTNGWIEFYCNGVLEYSAYDVQTLVNDTASYHIPYGALYLYGNTYPPDPAPTRTISFKSLRTTKIGNLFTSRSVAGTRAIAGARGVA